MDQCVYDLNYIPFAWYVIVSHASASNSSCELIGRIKTPKQKSSIFFGKTECTLYTSNATCPLIIPVAVAIARMVFPVNFVLAAE
jgi:hypothetical protein